MPQHTVNCSRNNEKTEHQDWHFETADYIEAHNQWHNYSRQMEALPPDPDAIPERGTSLQDLTSETGITLNNASDYRTNGL